MLLHLGMYLAAGLLIVIGMQAFKEEDTFIFAIGVICVGGALWLIVEAIGLQLHLI